ncbi:MAG: MarC family protein [Candidatus Altiarchaeota archaeon]|nr:MarC family protein [Candidatus Altiarchaeota archaeon]
MEYLLTDFMKAAFAFLVIMDPFVSALYFLSISKKFKKREKTDAVNSATLIAGTTLFAFLIVGPLVLSVLGITLESFQVAGGLVLFIISVKFILGSMGEVDKVSKNTSIMVIGVPLITGPGVLTTTIMLVLEYGYLLTAAAAMTALSVVWIIMRHSERIEQLIGWWGMETTSRIMGLLLSALAVEFIKNGVTAMLA